MAKNFLKMVNIFYYNKFTYSERHKSLYSDLSKKLHITEKYFDRQKILFVCCHFNDYNAIILLNYSKIFKPDY